MASIWKGSIAFGLVSIPVELRTAVRDHRLSFRMLHGKDQTPIKFKRVREDTGKEVPWGEIVKGHELDSGEFVVLEQKDFRDAAVEQSHTIDIQDFVDEHTIDPRYYENGYFLVPAKGGDRAYALLREAMAKTKTVGIGKIILHQRQHIAELRPDGDALVLMMLRFADELMPADDLSVPSSDTVAAKELKMATELVESLRSTFDPSVYKDEYDANLRRIIESKAKGKKLHLEGPEKGGETPKILDLMEKLKASLETPKTKAAPGGRTKKRKSA